MHDICEQLWEIRRLRLSAANHYAWASEYMTRASYGMSTRRAVNVGGTGKCPLTDYAACYSRERKSAEQDRRAADERWTACKQWVDALANLDARLLVECYYNCAMSWAEVRATIKRSESAVYELHREALRSCNGMQAEAMFKK
ncbi:MAG: hypothetical protein RR521_06770 [Clostridia bacterium]